jgi:transposase
MVYARIHRALKRWQKGDRILPQSSLGKAISYALGQWESLAVYLKDGTIGIGNNLVENAIRLQRWAKRIGCFSAMPTPGTAAPYFTLSWSAAAVSA